MTIRLRQVLIVSLVVILPLSCMAQNRWQRESRLTLGWKHDSNIFESEGDSVGAGGPQVSLYLSLFHRKAKSSLRLDYRGGTEIYQNHREETRLVQDISAVGTLPAGKNWICSARAGARVKWYPQLRWGYTRLQISPGLYRSFTPGVSISFLGMLAVMNYSGSTYYDNRETGGGLAAHLRPNRNLLFSLETMLSLRVYDRPAWQYNTTDFWAIAADKQQDVFMDLNVTGEWRGPLLFRFALGFRRQSSNSFGYSFWQPLLSLQTAVDLGAGVVFMLHGSLRTRHYDDRLDPALLTRPGGESEENTFLLLDFSRDIRSGLTLHVRGGRYQDESPLAGRYYNKNIITSSLSFRF